MIIHTLATCHNRREKTLASLTDLHRQELPDGVTLKHTIVDDGSTDGTFEAVRSCFPQVQVISGSGNLYWAGGMRFGWEKRVQFDHFDYLFVYNDDVRFHADAIDRLISTSIDYLSANGTPIHAVVGAFSDAKGERTTYGGANKEQSTLNPLCIRRVAPPESGYSIVDTMNMNGVLVATAALSAVGFLSNFFIHHGADFEYGLKLNNAGGRVLLASRHIGICDRNRTERTELEPGISLLERYRRLLSAKRLPPFQRMYYYRKHGPWFWPIIWALPYLKLPLKHLIDKKRIRTHS